METIVYNQKGVEVSKISLPESVFGVKWNSDMVHQVVQSILTSARKPYAHVKTRGEVRGGGKKPWQQKGTGRARHGSSRSPIWVGGGVAHGPRQNEETFFRKINKKMKAKALFAIISRKFKDGEVLFVDEIKFNAPKTVEAIEVLNSLSKVNGFDMLMKKKNNSIYLANFGKDTTLEKSFANLGNVMVDEFRNINHLDILNKKFLVITNPTEAVKFLESKMGGKADAKASKVVERNTKNAGVAGKVKKVVKKTVKKAVKKTVAKKVAKA